MVKALVGAGFQVEFTFLSNIERAREVEDACAGLAKGTQVDNRSVPAIEAYVQRTVVDGPVLALVNNAGQSNSSLLDRLSPTEFLMLFETNVVGMHTFCKAVLPTMRRAGEGAIVNVSSLAARNVRAGNVAYGVTKLAVERYTQGLALECSRFNVRANVLAPGFVETDMVMTSTDSELLRRMRQDVPSRKVTTVDDVANAMLTLIIAEPPLFGVVLPVGGGGQI